MHRISRGRTDSFAHQVASAIGISQGDAENNRRELDEKIVNLAGQIQPAERRLTGSMTSSSASGFDLCEHPIDVRRGSIQRLQASQGV
jgi:hypothetical protein